MSLGETRLSRGADTEAATLTSSRALGSSLSRGFHPIAFTAPLGAIACPLILVARSSFRNTHFFLLRAHTQLQGSLPRRASSNDSREGCASEACLRAFNLGPLWGCRRHSRPVGLYGNPPPGSHGHHIIMVIDVNRPLPSSLAACTNQAYPFQPRAAKTIYFSKLPALCIAPCSLS